MALNFSPRPDWWEPPNDFAKIWVVGVGHGGARVMWRMKMARVAGVLLGTVLPSAKPVEEDLGLEVLQAILPADMLVLLFHADDLAAIRAATEIAVPSREQEILTVAITTQPACSAEEPDISVAEQALGALERVADRVVYLDDDSRIAADGSGEAEPEEAAARLEEAFITAVRVCVEPITVPGLVGTDFADVKTVLAGGGPAIIGFGQGRGDEGAEAAVDMAVGRSTQRGLLLDASAFLVWIVMGVDVGLHAANQAISRFEAHTIGGTNIIYGVITHESLPPRSFLFGFMATGVRRVIGQSHDRENGL